LSSEQLLPEKIQVKVKGKLGTTYTIELKRTCTWEYKGKKYCEYIPTSPLTSTALLDLAIPELEKAYPKCIWFYLTAKGRRLACTLR